jgi:hypothetical protein
MNDAALKSDTHDIVVDGASQATAPVAPSDWE